MKYKLMNEELFILRSRDTIFVFKSAYEPNSEINKVSWFETNSRKKMLMMKEKQYFWGDGLNLNLYNNFDSEFLSGDGRPPGGSRGRSQGRRLLCRGPRWHHDHLQEEGGSLIWWLALWLACLVDMFGWRDWHVRLTWRLAWWLTATEGVKLDESMVRKNPLSPNQSHLGSLTKYILWSSLHDRQVRD